MKRRPKLNVVEVPPMKLIPPNPEACQICGYKHPVEHPHNPQSLYWKVKFQIDSGRAPTWNDALAHCEPNIQEFWWANLAKYGITKENGKVNV